MSKYLGDVSAYAYAVSKGYTGTEEEFAELMASYATVAEAAAESAEQAASSASAASGSASTASTAAGTATTKAEEASQSATNANQSATQASGSATTAQGAAQTATAKANEASASAATALQQAQNAMTHASNAQTFANNAQTSATQAAASANTANDSANLAVEAAEEATTTVANKADKDGSYPDMSVGNVFSDDSYTEDKTPYLYRVSGGGIEVGKVEADKIVGGTVAWNQQVPINETTRTVADVEVTSNNDGTYTLNGTATAIAANYWFSSGSYNTIQNHIMLLKDVVIVSSSGLSTRFSSQLGGIKLYKCEYSEKVSFRMPNFQNGKTYSNVKVVPQLFDLTQMFGSTIADYIYTLGQTTGVAFFRKMFPNAYYPYNAGELMHVSGLSEHLMTGFNWFDEGSAEWIASYYINANGGQGSSTSYRNTSTFTQVLSNTPYAYSVYKTSTVVTSLSVAFYDADKNFISRSTPSAETSQIGVNTVVITTPVNARYARLNAPTDSKDICISLSSSRNGEYEPYVKHSYPLDSSLTLRGLPKLDSSNNLYYDGDVYSSDGKVQRKYGVKTFNGTETWSFLKYGESGIYRAYINVSDISTSTADSNVADIISNLYPTIQYQRGSVQTGISGRYGYTQINVFQSVYTTVEAFKSALATNPLEVVYLLATPNEETAQAYTEYQKVSKYGTEEYVSTGIVPVGHITKYPTDIVAKVDGLPSDFSTLIAPTEKGFTATRAYSVNQFMIINNQLYKATASIANGATITPNTNVTAVTVADILTSLLNA